MRKIGIWAMMFALTGLMACSSGSSSSDDGGGSSVATITSLGELPQTTSIFNAEASASVSVATSKTAAGTPPLVRDITPTLADTIFWDGLIALINGGEDVTQQIAEDFFNGEGSCRMTQTTGYLIQELQMFGVSICYMQQMPDMSEGVTIDQAPSGVTRENIFDKRDADLITQVNANNMPAGQGGQTGDQTIFIKVYGNDSTTNATDYWIDLWFCANGTANGYEEVRVDGADGSVAQASYHTEEEGNFYANFAGSLTAAADGTVIYDPSASQTATVYDNFYGIHNGQVSVVGNLLTGMEHAQELDQNQEVNATRKILGLSEFTGTSVDTLRFVQGGFAGEMVFGEGTDTFDGAIEYQNTLYENVGANGQYYSDVQNYDFSANSFYSGTLAMPTEPATTLQGFSCSETPDVIVTMDGSDAGVAAQAANCESTFQDMNFCDNEDIGNARGQVEAFMFQEPQ